ncbi:MAG: RsmB/NOP family class I SAM-dependent RNA methyltransferase [Clostridia bacterium]|nr:RsmB/NOP family class I SAM-dependent RNA methyltransferase [Clostridia bacterium]
MPELPQAFVSRVADSLGEALPAFLSAMADPPLRGLRLNPFKPVPEGCLPGLGGAVPWEPTGRFLAADSPVGSQPLHEAGACYIQEPSAMLPAAVLAPRPGEKVLDLCAAPGGKSTQLGLRLVEEGLLVCNEIVPKRAQILSGNVERLGLTRCLVISERPDALVARWPGGFDAVLADAPCSGEGMFRRNPEAIQEWSKAHAAGCAARQAEILDSAAALTRPGGRLVYSTCTFNPAENEDNVKAFLRRHPDFSLTPFALPGVDAPEGMATLWPHLYPGEGQFAALMKRAGDAPAFLPPDASLPAPDRAALRTLSAFAPDAPHPDALLGQTLTCLPGCPDLRGLRVLRRGLHLGAAKDGRFVPDHAWALAVTPPALPRVSLTEAEARRYLAGETLAQDAPNGWAFATVEGLPLGWVKLVNGTAKNHYPKGLRRNLSARREEDL